MLPKIKKNISSFISDERGTISKKKLVAGALTLMGLSIVAKKAKAEMAGDKINSEGTPTLLGDSGYSKYECESEDIEVGGAPFVKTTCNAVHVNNCASSSNHKNIGQGVHTNAAWAGHKNRLSMKYDDKDAQFTGKHAHHGQHANADVACKNTHSNHCQHSNHGDGGWC